MSKLLTMVVLMLTALPALAQEAAVDADTSADKSAAADAAGDTDKEFKPPPGFKTKKRGEIVVYCMRDSTVGTRFKTEKCYDQEQMREYLLALEIQKRDIDRVRSTCGTGSVCAPQ